MQNRRKFLQQTALAAGAMMTSNSLFGAMLTAEEIKTVEGN